MGQILNRRRVMGGKSSLLPQGYTQVEWIQNVSRDSYISTGYEVPIGCQKLVLQARLCFTEVTGTRQLIGADNGQWIGMDGSGKWDFAGSGDVAVTLNQFYECENRVFINTQGKRQHDSFVDNVLVKSITTSATSINRNRQYIFNITYNRPDYAMLGKISNYRIYTDNVLRRDYIPCISPSNEVGMYDLVTDSFYTTPAGDAFVAGPVV